MIVVELTAAVDAAGTLQTFYMSTDPFVSKPTDTPTNTEFRGTLQNPGSFGTSVFTDGRNGGAATLQYGEMVLENVDGIYDAFKTYSFDGRPITVRLGDPTTAYPGTMTTIFKGTVEAVELTWGSVIVRVMDKQRSLQIPMLPNAYLGNNGLPNGIEGVAGNIKGRKKPRVYGKVYNVQPECVNTSLLIYQLSDRAVNSIDAVYDRGVALAFSTNYTTNALLQAAGSPAAGSYHTCLAEGLFRLGATPAGYPTADATEGASASLRTPAQILSRMATDAGLTTVAGDITAMDALTVTAGTPWECGIYVTESMTFEDAMNAIAKSVNAAYYFDGSGNYRMAILSAASGTAVITITEDLVLPAIERITPPSKAIPPWAVVLHHSRIYTVQDTDLAGAVTAVQRAFLADEYRTVRSEDSAIKTQFLLAEEFEAWTQLSDQTGATALVEAARRLGLYKVNPEMYKVPVPLDTIQGTTYKMLDVVSLTVSRFSLSGGKLFRLLGVDLELADNTAFLLLWG